MANHLKRDRQIAVLRLLVEGNSIRSTERLTGVTKRAILRLLVRFGDSCQDLMKERFCDLSLRHVQVDEMHTFVGTRQVNLRVDQKDDPNIGEQYLWYGIDQDTKLVPTFLVGKRSADNARRLMVDLRSRLAIPTPGEADRRGGYKPIIKISTDGLAAYPEAVDLAFGPYAEYGQLIKNYRNANMPGKYSPGELTGADRRPVFGDMNPWTICTSHIERANLTVRTFVRRFTRLSLGFSKKLKTSRRRVPSTSRSTTFAGGPERLESRQQWRLGWSRRCGTWMICMMRRWGRSGFHLALIKRPHYRNAEAVDDRRGVLEPIGSRREVTSRRATTADEALPRRSKTPPSQCKAGS